MVLRAPSDLVLDEVARPQPGPGQVLVRITHSGICGTDWKIYNGSIPVPYPLIPGHEMAGHAKRRDEGRHPCLRDDETVDEPGEAPGQDACDDAFGEAKGFHLLRTDDADQRQQ